MRHLLSWSAACLLAIACAGCMGVDNSAQIPENPDPPPAAAPEADAPEPMAAP